MPVQACVPHFWKVFNEGKKTKAQYPEWLHFLKNLWLKSHGLLLLYSNSFNSRTYLFCKCNVKYEIIDTIVNNFESTGYCPINFRCSDQLLQLNLDLERVLVCLLKTLKRRDWRCLLSRKQKVLKSIHVLVNTPSIQKRGTPNHFQTKYYVIKSAWWFQTMSFLF